jgi:photosystem II stability/assembly factor-like uncharacterized protein
MKLKCLFLFLFFAFHSVFSQGWYELSQKPIPNYYEVKAAFDREWQGKEYQKGQGVSTFKRWEAFMLRHMDKDGNYNRSEYQQSYQDWKKTTAPLKTAKLNNLSWTLVGPDYSPGTTGTNNNGIGRVKDICFHPTDTNIFYIGSETGGLWKTTDCGTTYTFLSQQWPNTLIENMFLNPSNPMEIWVYIENALMKTTNGGTTWTTLTLSGNQADAISFYMNFAQNRMLLNTFYGTYYSSDGITWTLATGTPTFTTNFLRTFVHDAANSAIVYGVNSSNIYKSSNGGQTFTALNPTGITFGSTINRIAVSANAPNSVFIMSVNNYRLVGVFKSTDGGASFTKILDATTSVASESNPPGSSFSADATFGGQGFIHASFAVSPTDASRMFVGGVSLFYTPNGGANWYGADDGFPLSPHVDYMNIRFQPVSNQPFACSDGGLYKAYKHRASNGVMIWESLNENISITQMYTISTSADGSQLITGQQDNGAFVYEVGTSFWDFLSIGDGMATGYNAVGSTQKYLARQNGNLSIYNGDVETDLLNSSSLGESANFYTVMKTNNMVNGRLYMIRNNLWKSEDYGANWTNITSSIGSSFTNGDLALCHNNPNVLAIYNSSSIYLSEDNGASWTSVNLPKEGLNPIYVTQLAIHSNNPDILWASNNANVYATTDRGQTWTKYSTWPSLSVNKIVHVDGTTDRLLIATTLGVFEKSEGSASLQEVSSGLPKVDVKDLTISYCTNKVYIATYGRGAWQSAISLNASACCKNIQFTTPPASFICDGGSAAVQVSTSGTCHWILNNTPLTSNANPLLTQQTGAYQVYASSGTCQTATTSFELSNASGNGAPPFCKAIQNAPLSNDIMVTEDHSIPLNIATLSGCSNHTSALKCDLSTTYFNPSNKKISFMLREMNLQQSSNVSLIFDIANPRNVYSNAANNLTILASSDCGATYTQVYSGTENDLSVNTGTFGFTPASCNDWKSITVSLAAFQGQKVLLKFEFSSYPDPNYPMWGGNFYLDNICLNGTTGLLYQVNINEDLLQVMPNPGNDIFHLNLGLDCDRLELISPQGQVISLNPQDKSINLNGYPAGMYTLKASAGLQLYTKRIIKTE